MVRVNITHKGHRAVFSHPFRGSKIILADTPLLGQQLIGFIQYFLIIVSEYRQITSFFFDNIPAPEGVDITFTRSETETTIPIRVEYYLIIPILEVITPVNMIR